CAASSSKAMKRVTASVSVWTRSRYSRALPILTSIRLDFISIPRQLDECDEEASVGLPSFCPPWRRSRRPPPRVEPKTPAVILNATNADWQRKQALSWPPSDVNWVITAASDRQDLTAATCMGQSLASFGRELGHNGGF